MADLIPIVLPAAVLNGALTALLFVLAGRSRLRGLVVALIIPLLFATALMLPAGTGPVPARHSNGVELGTYLVISLVTWCPGAVIALIPVRRPTRLSRSIGVVATFLGCVMGALVPLTGLYFICVFLGNCL